ncbi:hypothetical protein EF888_19920 [Silicimonas algicola]|uniref:Capsule biosynthesis CapC-like protein n=1 Tax=Silicimonas algicola TaxID=1826607 RepID=A0A316G2G1_9RHOB|nr:poly-gamma-glutamate biosynthesis protein PgsC/CapC [Silicimonas algicola]AZQ69199.1 hypothetical protein EF888_19920 [Silicimonas algicola]PWK54988.1 capsule biosynthesis CapC-like protein [Silicimonas algicola]
MGGFVLDIFPEGSLASSVITTTWLGVFVVAFFNLRFGWVLSGLVVPGYLVPLLIAKPLAAGVVIVEAIVTYLIVWTFSERWSGGRTWSSVFGRDRFLALVLTSVLVRLVFDAWALPELGAWLVERHGIRFDYRSDLHSFGLIIISLLANQFWKPGLLRGLASAAVTIGVTWLLVRFVLIEFTNFRISEVGYLYEGFASSILASPKSYIILVTTAVIASRMNLLYGWDFSGILIPALIALQWYQPVKVLASFAEAFVVLGVATMLLRSRFFADATIEGARKLILFFNVSFAYKLLLGHALLWTGWEIKVTDYFGFGYLLSTLMAMKMHEKQIAARFSRAVLQVSLVGAALGSLIGFALKPVRLPDAWLPAPPTPTESLPAVAQVEELGDAVVRATMGAYLTLGGAGISQATPGELDAFRRGVELLLERGAEPEAMARASALLAEARFDLSLANGRYLILSGKGAAHGGTYVLDPSASGGLTVQVPDPLEVPLLVSAGAALLGEPGVGALAVAGTSSRNGGEALGVAGELGTFFQAFHEMLDAMGTLQLRGSLGPGARLQVDGAIPDVLDLPRLQVLFGDLEVDFGGGEEANLQRDTARGGFAELFVGEEAVRNALAGLGALATVAKVEGTSSLDGFLVEWMLDRIAQAGSKEYRPPRTEELIYLDRAVLAPLLESLAAGPEPDAARLAAIDTSARALDYQLLLHRHRRSGSDHVLLLPRPKGDSSRRHWGAFAFRVGGQGSYAVYVPRPLPDIGTLEAGLALYGALKARALLVAGAHPGAGRGGEADVLRADAPFSLYALASRAVVRQAEEEPLMHLLVRGMAAPLEGDVASLEALLAFDRSGLGEEPPTALAGNLRRDLLELGFEVGLVDGGADRVRYEIGQVPLARHLEPKATQGVAAVWLSPILRSSFAERLTDDIEAALFEALAIPTVEAEPLDALLAPAPATVQPLPARARALVDDFLLHRDAVSLARLQQEFSQLRLTRLADPASAQTFLLITDPGGAPIAMANIGAREPADAVKVVPGDPDPLVVSRFVHGRLAWLLVEGS